MQNKKATGRQATVFVSLAAVMLAGNVCRAQTEAAKPGQTTKFDIPAGDLAAALKSFGELSDTDVLFDPQLAAFKRTGGLIGRHETEEGLRILLAQANLKFRLIDGKTVLIESAEAAALSSSGAGAGSEESGPQLEEIIVTAQKRLERFRMCQYR